jgi:hypothetical protein
VENKYKPAWEKLESSTPRPARVRTVIETDYEEFRKKVQQQADSFVESIVSSLYAGDAYLLKRAFPADFMINLRKKVDEYWKAKPSEFFKMLEGSPDFHRIIDLEAGKKYSFRGCKHSCYFYPWNDDPLNLFEPIYERWRVMKLLMGLRPDDYEKNTPKDGVVDRIQVVRYPPGIGFLEPHSDPYLHQRVFFSGYMSKRGVDYQGGGFYLVGPGDKVVELEDKIDVGDVCIAYATVYHGVAPADRHKAPDWERDDGRWFLSMYSNASDEVPDRHTGHPVRLSIDGVLPDAY